MLTKITPSAADQNYKLVKEVLFFSGGKKKWDGLVVVPHAQRRMTKVQNKAKFVPKTFNAFQVRAFYRNS